jgi:hypothetical protein
MFRLVGVGGVHGGEMDKFLLCRDQPGQRRWILRP